MRGILARVMQWSTATLVLSQAPLIAADALVLSPHTQPQVVSTQVVSTAPIPIQKAPLFRHATYPGAWKAAQKSNRPILVYISMSNCPHCVKMVNNTYNQPHVKQLVADSFETIKADRYAHAKLVSSLKIRWYPTTVLVGPNNRVLDMIEGYVGPKQFEQRLHTGLASVDKPTVTQTR